MRSIKVTIGTLALCVGLILPAIALAANAPYIKADDLSDNQIGDLSDVDETGAASGKALVGDGAGGFAPGSVDDDTVAFDDADSNWTATTIGAALEELDEVLGGGVPNQTTGKVDWSELVNVPSGFADNDDASGVGGGYTVYAEEGDAARVNNGSAAMYLDFDDSDFDLGVVSNEANITVNNSGIDHDALTNFSADEHFTQASITTVGTVTSGTWNATDVGLAAGGLGADTSSYTGLVGISGSAVSEVDTMAELETMINSTNIIESSEMVGVNEAYGVGWNSDTGLPEKDDIYDYLITLDVGADGDVDAFDATALAAAETDPKVDTEAEIEAITGAKFGTSKAVTTGYVWVADGTDFESVVTSGDVTIASGGATTIGADKIVEGMLSADNSAADGDVLTYDSTGTNFAWITPNAGTDITANLEEEVTEGSLADSTIVSGDIKDATIAAADISDTLDLSGKTSFAVPASATPTAPNASGEVAVDTNLLSGSTGQGILELYSGIQLTYLVGTTDTPGDNEIPKFDSTTGTITWEADADSGGSPKWNSIANPDGNQALNLSTFTTTWTNVGDFNLTNFDAVTLGDGVLLDLSGITPNTATEGLKLPLTNAGATAEGQVTWDGTNDRFVVGDSATQKTFYSGAHVGSSVDASEIDEDAVGTSELDDDANTPVAGSFVIVETGAASFDYIAANAGTDVTADLEEEAHTSEHAVSGGDSVYPADPAADGILFWDDNPGTLEWAAVGSGLSYDGTTLTASAGSGDIESVWTDDTGDVSALTATTGDTLNATSADSTIPWRCNNTAAPTTDGEAIWDADNNILTIGTGETTYYVAYGVSDGDAAAGDTATAFFDAGSIERARGGTGTDTSAYGAGLFGSDGSNNTIDVDTETELETALGSTDVVTVNTDDVTSANMATLISDETGSGKVVFDTSPTFTTGITVPADSISNTELDESANFTWTGAHDFGGASSVEMKNAASATIDADGEFYLETDQNQIVVQAGDGTTIAANQDVALPLIQQKDFTILQPDLVRAVSDDVCIMTVDSYNYPTGITIVAIRVATSASSTDTYLFEHWDDPVGTTQVTVDSVALSAASEVTETSITDATVESGYYINLNLDDSQDDIAWVHGTIYFYAED